MTLDKRPYSPYFMSFIGGILTAIFSSLPQEGGFITLLANYLACVPIAIVFLSQGANKGIVASFISLALILISQGRNATAIVGLTHIFPCAIIAVAALRKVKFDERYQWYPAGYLVSWLAVLCCIYIVFIVTMIHQQGSDPQSLIKDKLMNMVGPDLIHHISPIMLDLLPGLMGLSLSIMALVNLNVAQRLCQWKKIQLRPYPTDYDGHYFEFWDMVFVASFMLLLTDGQIFAFIGKNMMLVSCLPLFFLGLSTVSCWLGQFENGRLWFGILIVMCVLLLWPSFIVVALGVLEPTINIKKRLIVNKDLD